MSAISPAAFDEEAMISRRPRPVYDAEAFTQTKVRVPMHRSVWMRELHTRFEEVTSLSRNWDGYRGKAVSFRVASFAASLLERLCNEDVPAPSLVPGSDGSLQIEWHRSGYDVEIDIRAPLDVECYRNNIHTREEDELQLTTDFTSLQSWIADLV